jgi:hypothetical protein
MKRFGGYMNALEDLVWPKLGGAEDNMKVQLERCGGHFGVEMPVRFRFGARDIKIVETVDQWYGPVYCYFKIKGDDGNFYILRFDEGRAEWELTMFQTPGAHSTHLHSKVTPDVRVGSMH